MRTSPIHYIAPSAISIVPNCNGSANDLAVTISRGTKIKVYSPRAGIDKTTNGEYQEWTLTGRNRRLADSTKPYTIYARLSALDNTAYLIFAPMTSQESGEYMIAWTQAYSWVTTDGLYVFGKGTDWEEQRTKTNCIFVRLGDVSLPDANNQRTVTLDTGILGTEQFNDEWALRPDELPLRIELGCTIGDEDAGPTPYVYWGQSLVLTAMLTEGWTGTDIQRFDRWEIIRNSGDAAADNAWNYQEVEGQDTLSPRLMPDGQITLNHARGADDDFNGTVSVTFTILAVGHNADTLQDEILRTATINIMAETVEKYELSLSESIVSYDPQTRNYSPDGGVNVGIRATDQRGEMFEMTRGQIANASLVAEYSSVGSTQWTTLTFSGSSQEAATANINKTAFALQQSVNVRLMRRITADGQTVAEKELSRATIAFVRNGEDSKIREWIYRLNSNAGYDATTGTAGGTAVSGQTDGVDNCLLVDDFVPTGWSDDPTGVSQPGDVEWESWRDYDDENHRWGVFHAPVIHNRYAEDAVTYEIVPSVSIINATADGTITTGAIAVSAYKIEGGTRSKDILPALDSVYRVKFSVDNGDWTNCTREFGAGRRSYRTYIPAASVQTTTSTIRLQLLDEDGNVIGLFPGITVVKDGADSETWDIITSVDQLLPTEEGEVALAVRKTIGGVATNYTLDNLPSGITMTAYVDSSDVSSYIEYTSDSQIYGFVIAAGQKLTLRLYKSGTLVAERSVVCVKNGDNAPYNEHAYALSRSRTSHADGDLYQVNGVRWFPSAPDPRATHPYVWERIMHYTAAGVNDRTSYICLTGAVGAMGKLCYMAGEYRADVEYTSNDSQTVAVEVSGTNDTTDIYYLNAESNVKDGRHIGPTDSGQTIWVQGMSQYNLVRARYLFADFAQFGAAVVSGDWLISVHGTINGTAYEGEYTDPDTYINGGKEKPTYFWFDPAYPNEDHAGKYKTPGSSSSGQWASDHHNFIPHYAVNLLTGRTYQNDAVVRGVVDVRGSFKGLVTANAFYSDAEYLIGGDYIIDMVNNPHAFFVSKYNFADVTLPNPNSYEGLELQFFHILGPRSGVGWIKFLDTIYFLEVDQYGNRNTGSLTNAYAMPNTIIRLKAIDNRWWLADGELHT